MDCSSLIRRLRGCVFAHSLCRSFGCPHNKWALARCGFAWSHKRHPEVSSARNNKWLRLLEGSELRDNRRMKELLLDFPALWSVRSNSLWVVLSTLWDKHHHTDQLAQTLKLKNGFLLPTNLPFLMRRLCGCPDWCNLGCVLALLGSTSKQFAPHRAWLRARFLTYLILVCMAEPCCFVREPLYELLNALYKRGFFELDDWPSDFAAFEQACQVFSHYGNWMRHQGWISGWDLYACTLLQHYQPDQDIEWQNASLLVGPPIPVVLPSQVSRRVEMMLKQHRRDQFTMVGRDLCLLVLTYARGGGVRLRRQIVGERKPSSLQPSLTAAFCG